MKKILKYFAMACLSFVMLIGMNSAVFAADATLTSSSTTVRAGDTITLTLKVPHKGSYGITAALEYDSNQVTLANDPALTKSLSDAGWVLEKNGSTLVVYDNNYATPLTGSETLLTVKFKVNSNVAEGTQVNISVKNIVSTDGNTDTNIGAATYSITVARALSANANLGSLVVTGSTLSPAFKPGTTVYDLGEVEYSVTALDIQCTTENENATYTIKNNTLSVGKNTVSIVVTSENGTQKTYKLNVTRKQDPNYVAGSNANLKSLKVSHGILSPKFNADITDYIVYLPYEYIGTSFTATGTEADSKAQGVLAGVIDSLVEGKNQTAVVCRAEDGTEKTYAIVVYVMPKYEGSVPTIDGANGGEVGPGPGTDPGDTENPPETSTEEPSELPTEDVTEDVTETPSESEKDEPTVEEPDNSLFITILVILVVILLVGALVYVLFFTKKNK